MKQNFQAAIISLLLLLIISHTSSRRLSSNQLGESSETEHNEITLLQKDEFSSLMGLKECGGKDEDCQKRRMVAEAHLDYIYTQHYKP